MPALESFAYADGRWQPFADAKVPLDDRAFMYGDAVFETLRVDGGLWFAEAHWRRLSGSLRALLLPARALAEVRQAASTRPRTAAPYALRVIVSRGRNQGALRPSRTAAVYAVLKPASMLARRVRLIAARLPRPEPPFLPWHAKHANYLPSILALAKARATEDVVWCGRRGQVLETSIGNVFALRAGVLCTPPLDGRVLPGVTRAVVLDVARALGARVAERTFSFAALREADECFVTSSLRGLTPVTHVAGERLPRARPLTNALISEYRQQAWAQRSD